MSKKKIVVLGDPIQDILVAEEGARPIVWEKGNLLSAISSNPEREAIPKAGGVRYTIEFCQLLMDGKDIEVATDAHQIVWSKANQKTPYLSCLPQAEAETKVEGECADSGEGSPPEEGSGRKNPDDREPNDEDSNSEEKDPVEIVSGLFGKHSVDSIYDRSPNATGDDDPSDITRCVPTRMIWQVSLRPRTLGGDLKDRCWRATARLGSSPVDRAVLQKEAKDDQIAANFFPSDDKHLGANLNVLVDYNRHFRRLAVWNENDGPSRMFSEGKGIQNVVMIANDLPKVFFGRKDANEPLWDQESCLRGKKKRTVVITSINTLRRGGAVISRRQSWDRTVDDFAEAIHRHEFLRNLLEYAHVVIRVGVTAAFYCYRDEGTDEIEIEFLYDPKAPGVVFREPTDQGSMFATRAAFTSCIAKALINLENPERPENQRTGIRSGIRFALKLSQTLYPTGFGNHWDEVRAFPWEKEPLTSTHRYSEAIAKVKEIEKKLKEKSDTTLGIDFVKVPTGSNVISWNLLTASWGGINEPPLQDRSSNLQTVIQNAQQRVGSVCEINGSSFEGEEQQAIYQFSALERMRRLRCALQIAKYGPEEVINSQSRSESSSDLLMDKLLPLEWSLSRSVIFPNHPDSFEDQIQSTYTGAFYKAFKKAFGKKIDLTAIEHYLTHYPFNGPLAKYGKQYAVGQRDIENFNNVRNLIQQHVSSIEHARAAQPISLAVFGSPGNGKSFAINQIAEELGSNFESKTYNLSEFQRRDDLQQAFLEIAAISAAGKIPLVFFDEFDSVFQKTPFGWLKYFLAPMQDGTFRHNDGMIVLGGAVMIFAGGICESFAEFRSKAQQVSDVKETPSDNWNPKDVKMPDFVSRLRGHIDIPGINRVPRAKMQEQRSWQSSDDHYTPYVRRGLLIHSLLHKRGLVDKESHHSGVREHAAQLDDDLLRALLTVSRYEHGARSIESVLSIMMRMGSRIEKAGLPLITQLNMHVPGAEFWVRTVFPHNIWPVESLALIPAHGLFRIDREVHDWAQNFAFVDDAFIEVTSEMLRAEIGLLAERRKSAGAEVDEEIGWFCRWADQVDFRPEDIERDLEEVALSLQSAFVNCVEEALGEELWSSGGIVPSETRKFVHAFCVRDTRYIPLLIRMQHVEQTANPVFKVRFDRYMDPRRAALEVRRNIHSVIRTMTECEWRNSLFTK